MKTVLILALVIMAVLLGWFTYLNRDSDKVLGTVLASVTSSLLAVLLVLAFGAEKSLISSFPARVYYSRQSFRLVAPTEAWRVMPADSVMSNALERHPERFADKSTQAAERVFHDLLQKSIIDWLAMHYPGNWQVQMQRFKLPSETSAFSEPTDDPPFPGDIIRRDQLVAALGANLFAADTTYLDVGIGVPRNTRLKVIVPPRESPSVGEIVLDNGLCHITIKTRSGGGFGIGPPLELQNLIRFPPAQAADFAYVGYVMTTRIEYNKFRLGDPRMQSYKRWAEQLTAELRRDFDEQLLWQDTKDLYRLRDETRARETQQKAQEAK